VTQRQKTIAQCKELSGAGLHTGHPVHLRFCPADQSTGIRFRRIDLPGAVEIPALVENVAEISRGTVLGKNGAKVFTVEHVLAAIAGLEIDNLIVELSSDEPPVMDGSAAPFVAALQSAGIVEQDAVREYFELDKTIAYHSEKDGVDIVVVPSAEYRITYMIDYPHPSVGTQYTSMYSLDEFITEFSAARTFCLLSETEDLKLRGLIQGGSLDNAVVFVDRDLNAEDMLRLKRLFHHDQDVKLGQATLDDRPLRYRNEPVRHKTVDLIGDLALVGVPIRGHVLAARGGHASHVEVARMLRKAYETQALTRKYGSKGGQGYVFDSEAISRLLPHRYPMLLVDRILELSPMEKVVGIKNVTRNEPFFNGHFPGHPVMPGVLIIEAMGQTGGVLLLNSVEHPESKVVYFTGLDSVKFRKTVIPGDQIRFEVVMNLFRRGLCKMRGEAFVNGVLVAEAEMSAVIVER
jgi:UDP-3-O-[3-hydroxymyristoyl] N-acetylglucosamine deacetylase / 3-hydroxyacyl-[acyl-carrier-protein] dehydratase